MTQEKLREALDAQQKVDSLRKQIKEWKQEGIVFGGWKPCSLKADDVIVNMIVAYYEGKLAQMEKDFEAL